MRRLKKILLSALPLMFAVSVWAQNASSSPSSRFGYGEMNDNVPTIYRAMGGLSTGMRSNMAINPSQPASYTACDTTSFMFDVAASLLWTNYRDANGANNKMNGNLEYVTLQIPIYKQYVAFSCGVMPYTSMGYNFSLEGDAGGHKYSVLYAGEGGITQLYGGLSVNICNWVALGANFYYMFGSVSNSTTLSFTEASIKSAMMYKNLQVSSFRFRYGMQLFHTFANRHKVVLGGAFENKASLKGEYVQYELNTLDSVLVSNSTKSNPIFEVPMYYSAGVSYTYDRRLTVGVEYSNSVWSQVNYFGEKDVLSDRGRITMGLEYRHNPMSRHYAERMYWRVGANVLDSYVKANNKKDFGVSVGMGFPLRTSNTMINTTIEYQHRASVANMQENVLRLVVDAAINENWFFKRKL